MLKKFSPVAFVVGFAVVGVLVTSGVAQATVPVLSQTSVTVGLGKSASVSATNGVSLYLDLNSSPTIASASANGTQVTVTGASLGSSNVTVCAVGTASDCTVLSVTVQAQSISSISFSQSPLSLSIGGNQSVTISGGNGTYTISNNSNTSVASTNLSGNSLAVSGLAAGGATITACDTSNTNTCGTLSVTVSSSNASGLSFGQNNISLAVGGSQTITISGGNGAYQVSGISNTSIVSAGMSGSSIVVDAIAPGSGTITVCEASNASICGTLSVTVTGSASTSGQAIVFSVTNPTLTVGQTSNVQISGTAPSYFIFSNGNAGVVQGTMPTGNTLSLYGASAGTDSITVCAAGGAGCLPLSITVTSSANTATTTPAVPPAAAPVVTPTVAPSVPTVPPSTVVANAALLVEIQTLQTAVTQALTQLQSVQSQLNQLEAQVNAGSGSGISTNTNSAPSAASGASYNFTELLTVGSQDAQVTALQNRLAALGFYSGPITGYYGTLTEQAVSQYQTAHGITATGYTGPSTRTALNAGN